MLFLKHFSKIAKLLQHLTTAVPLHLLHQVAHKNKQQHPVPDVYRPSSFGTGLGRGGQQLIHIVYSHTPAQDIHAQLRKCLRTNLRFRTVIAPHKIGLQHFVIFTTWSLKSQTDRDVL